MSRARLLLSFLTATLLVVPAATAQYQHSVDDSGDSASDQMALTPDGRFVAFRTTRSYDPGDTPSRSDFNFDVYRWDRWTDTYQWVSDGPVKDARTGALDISNDGSRIVFQAVSRSRMQVWIKDLVAGTLESVSVRPGGSWATQHCNHPRISGDGSTVVYSSKDNLIDPSDSGLYEDVFVATRVGTTWQSRIISKDRFGGPANNWSRVPEISSNGQVVAFKSEATDLVRGVTISRQVYSFDLRTNQMRHASVSPQGTPRSFSLFNGPTIKANGNVVLFAGSTDLDSSYTGTRTSTIFLNRPRGTSMQMPVNISPLPYIVEVQVDPTGSAALFADLLGDPTVPLNPNALYRMDLASGIADQIATRPGSSSGMGGFSRFGEYALFGTRDNPGFAMGEIFVDGPGSLVADTRYLWLLGRVTFYGTAASRADTGLLRLVNLNGREVNILFGSAPFRSGSIKFVESMGSYRGTLTFQIEALQAGQLIDKSPRVTFYR